MNLEFLIHLARSGASDIHPGGERATYALLQALDLHPQDRVLEIGCGTGNTMLRLLQRPAVTVVGLEFLPQMLSVARRRLQFAGESKQACLLRSNAAFLPFTNQSFDRAYSESVLGFQDVAILVKVLHEVERVLKPGGIFVANEAIWKSNIDPQVVAEINRSCEADFGLRQATDLPWDITHWLNAAKTAGFRVRSANLLEVHLEMVEEVKGLLSRRRYLPYWLYSQVFRFRRYLDRKTFFQHLCYRKLLRVHRQDGSYLDERLFILEKP